jgi:hypothetical protein
LALDLLDVSALRVSHDRFTNKVLLWIGAVGTIVTMRISIEYCSQ